MFAYAIPEIQDFF